VELLDPRLGLRVVIPRIAFALSGSPKFVGTTGGGRFEPHSVFRSYLSRM
jgi:hypothetical protein